MKQLKYMCKFYTVLSITTCLFIIPFVSQAKIFDHDHSSEICPASDEATQPDLYNFEKQHEGTIIGIKNSTAGKGGAVNVKIEIYCNSGRNFLLYQGLKASKNLHYIYNAERIKKIEATPRIVHNVTKIIFQAGTDLPDKANKICHFKHKWGGGHHIECDWKDYD